MAHGFESHATWIDDHREMHLRLRLVLRRSSGTERRAAPAPEAARKYYYINQCVTILTRLFLKSEDGWPHAWLMARVVRQFSKSKIDRAGEALITAGVSAEVRNDALLTVNNWRSCHAFPLNTFQNGLRQVAKAVDANSLVAQRIKRLASIEAKLKRFPTMTLSQMQDLGGCRAIVNDARSVLRVAEQYRRRRMKHKLHTVDNYIESPQASGYRGVHFIYRYFSDRNKTYNGQKIEVQLRSAFQHSWATAVETVGTFTQHALKSSIGPDEWLRFFALMGSVIAIREGTNRVKGTPEDTKVLIQELREVATGLDVINRLETYGGALTQFNNSVTKDAHYFLIQLEPEAQRTLITGFKAQDLELANERYLAIERGIDRNSSTDAVLVSVENITFLQRAYPNYFLDTTTFVNLLRDALRHERIRRLRSLAVSSSA